MSIQEVFKKGQEVLVQVAKEGLGQKGPALTTYLSLPGRYLVLMPAVQRLGVSKRIGDEDQRRELKDILNDLRPPEGMGLIVRTAGMGRGREELQRDFSFLVNTWNTLVDKTQTSKAPQLIFEEGDVVTRVFRDIYSDDVAEIVVDSPEVYERAKAFLSEVAPGAENKLRLYQGQEPLFHKFNVEPQLHRLFHRKVNLKSGGSIVIEQTEALMAIDVNTGRHRERSSQDETILATNLEAAREIARQLRLRDIGGLVMIDFIDMENQEHKRRVERELRMHLARDKARINVLQISSLGIVEMTRQRMRHSLRKTYFERCPHCAGSGHVKSPESMTLDVMRELRGMISSSQSGPFRVTLNPAVALVILNRFRRTLANLEETYGVSVELAGDSALPPSQWKIWTARGDGEWVLRKVSEVDEYVRNN